MRGMTNTVLEWERKEKKTKKAKGQRNGEENGIKIKIKGCSVPFHFVRVTILYNSLNLKRINFVSNRIKNSIKI